MARVVLIGALLAVLPIPLHANAAPKKSSTAGKKIDAYLTNLSSANHFSGAVVVAQKGKVLLSKGYGMAD
jgi:hypothetical protein